jgi:hypothetical protein
MPGRQARARAGATCSACAGAAGPIRKVAGARWRPSYFEAAIAAGAQAFITGEISETADALRARVRRQLLRLRPPRDRALRGSAVAAHVAARSGWLTSSSISTIRHDGHVRVREGTGHPTAADRARWLSRSGIQRHRREIIAKAFSGRAGGAARLFVAAIWGTCVVPRLRCRPGTGRPSSGAIAFQRSAQRTLRLHSLLQGGPCGPWCLGDRSGCCRRDGGRGGGWARGRHCAAKWPGWSRRPCTRRRLLPPDGFPRAHELLQAEAAAFAQCVTEMRCA